MLCYLVNIFAGVLMCWLITYTTITSITIIITSAVVVVLGIVAVVS